MPFKGPVERLVHKTYSTRKHDYVFKRPAFLGTTPSRKQTRRATWGTNTRRPAHPGAASSVCTTFSRSHTVSDKQRREKRGKIDQGKYFSFLLTKNELHWHIVITQSPSITLVITLGVAYGLGQMGNDMCPSFTITQRSSGLFLVTAAPHPWQPLIFRLSP